MNRREFVVGAASALVVGQLPAIDEGAALAAEFEQQKLLWEFEALVRSRSMPVMLRSGVVWVPLRPPGIL